MITYTNQPYIQIKATAAKSSIVVLGGRRYLADEHGNTANAQWLSDVRWLWLLDGMHYIEADDRLVPAFAPAAAAPASSLPAGTRAVKQADLNDLMAMVAALAGAR